MVITLNPDKLNDMIQVELKLALKSAVVHDHLKLIVFNYFLINEITLDGLPAKIVGRGWKFPIIRTRHKEISHSWLSLVRKYLNADRAFSSQ